MPVEAPVALPRALFVLNSLCVGGAEKQVVSLLNGLGRLGWRPRLQCLKDDGGLEAQIDARGVEVLPPLHVKSGFEPHAVRELARRIDAQAVDLLVCTNMYALLYGSLARALSRRGHQVRVVEVFHTTDPGSPQERRAMVVYQHVVRSAHMLVYVCHGQAAHWRQRGLRAAQEAVIYNGVDTRRFIDVMTPAEQAAGRARLGFGERDVVAGLCAVMRPEKAHGDLLEAIARLRAAGCPVRGLLIGDGPLRPAIEARIEALGLRGHVQVTGLLDDVRQAVSLCDLMVLPSHAVETFSIAALESMAMARPMVMTRIGGAAEQVGDGVDGRLYPPGDVAALAEAIAGLADRARCRELGQRAAMRVRAAFCIDRMVGSYADALLALAQGRPVRSDPPAQPLSLPG